MKKLLSVIAILLTVICVGCGGEDMSDIKYNDINAAEHNSELIAKAISGLGEGETLSFKAGDIYVSNPNGGFAVSGKKGITLKGDNTRLINTSYDPLNASAATYQSSGMLVITGSENITIEGFAIDYYAHPNICGIITEYKGGYTHFKAYDEYINGDKKVIVGEEYAFSTNAFDLNGKPTTETWISNESNKKLKAVDPDNGMFKIIGECGKVGEQICVRFTSGSYASPPIYVYDTKNLTLKNITVNSCPSAVVYAPCGNENFTFHNFNVRPAEGSQAILGSNEDSIHVKGLRGKLEVKNCEFIGLGDDALNVHSRAALIEKTDGSTITAKDQWLNSKLEDKWAKVGDEIEIFDKEFVSLGKYKLTSFTNLTSSKLTLENLSANLENAYVMQNVSYCPEVICENNTVERGRARGVLVQSKNMTIRNNSFKNLRLSAILISPDITYWYEMGPAENVEIADNNFDTCSALENSGFGVINIAIGHDDQTTNVSAYPHKNITIKNNTFKNCKAYAVAASYNDGLTLLENTFTNTPKPHSIKNSINSSTK